MTREQFVRAVDREQGPLRRFLRTLCRGDAALADDLAQEALIRAYLHFEDFNGRSRFSTWLYRIACNVFSDWRSAAERKGHTVGLDEPSGMRIAADADCPKDYKPLYDAIDALTECERMCVLLFYMEERSVAEIATITDLPVGTVKSHLFRGRNHLKEKLNTSEDLK